MTYRVAFKEASDQVFNLICEVESDTKARSLYSTTLGYYEAMIAMLADTDEKREKAVDMLKYLKQHLV